MPVARTHEKALVRQVDFDLIAAEPLPEFADVFTLDQHTVFGIEELIFGLPLLHFEHVDRI